MAEHLASIFGTKKDRVNCPFYFKISTCRQSYYPPLQYELSKYVEIESLNLWDNLADYMRIIVDFSPVTGFCEATCRQYDENTCNRGGYCNFMHLYRISRSRRRRSHSRSKSRSSHRFRTSCEEHSYGGHGHSKRYDDRDNYHEGRRKRNKEKRAKIEQSNWEREQQENAKIIDKDVANDNNENRNNGYV
uniref:C3H1-type domain-containing protein n=1 Tax=Gossypium raimondii TaxID=29730 RepID=A0A0D2PXP6_GOSRA|nr:hypothetical protein B456_001G119200 [Gossypium raimondii]